MGSIFSKILNKVTGLPEIDFRKKGGGDIIKSVVVAELIGDKGADLIKKVDDATLAALSRVIKDEQRRRIEE
jgi:hypothetical protein